MPRTTPCVDFGGKHEDDDYAQHCRPKEGPLEILTTPPNSIARAGSSCLLAHLAVASFEGHERLSCLPIAHQIRCAFQGPSMRCNGSTTHTHTLLVLLQPSSNQEETWMSHARSGADRNGRMNERTNEQTNKRAGSLAPGFDFDGRTSLRLLGIDKDRVPECERGARVHDTRPAARTHSFLRKRASVFYTRRQSLCSR